MVIIYIYRVYCILKMKKILSVFILSVLVSSFTYWQDFSIDKSKNLNYIQWEVIVKYKDSSKTKKDTKSKGISVFDAELNNNNLYIKEKLNSDGNIVLVKINNNNSVEETIDLLKSDPNIEFVEPNFIRYLFSWEDSYNITKTWQWALNAISWYDAFNTYSWALKEADPIVAWIIDNGVNYNHPDLVNSLWTPSVCSLFFYSLDCIHWYDFFHMKPTPLANSDSHWTHIAWIIAAEANNWIWITWINPYTKIASLKIWDSEILSSDDEIYAIYFAIENWIKVINASFWGDDYSDIEELAIENFWTAWWLFITAAGNEKRNIDNQPVYPCSYDLDNIICVGATNSHWNFADDYSNFWTDNIDIAAPGSNIISTITNWKSKSIFNENFDKDKWKCNTWWDTLNDWELIWTWWCKRFYEDDDNDYWYIFVNSLTSPFFSWDNDINFSAYIYCSSWVNLNFQYSTWNSNYTTFHSLKGISWTGMFHINLSDNIDDNINDNISLSFKISNNTNPISKFCIIDEIDVYSDPYSSWSNNIYGEKSWTSMATPHVVGLASMVWMINPDLSNLDVKRLILNNWDTKSNLVNKVKDWKFINVKKTLDEAAKINIISPTWLNSNWEGKIQWNNVSRAKKYYYEILSWDIIIDSGLVETTWKQTNLTWDYIWRVKWIDILWNESDFNTGYICKKPVLSISNLVWNFTWYECTSLVWDFTFSDNCSNNYEMWRVDWTWEATLNKSWVVVKQIYIRNSFWEESNSNVDYYFYDSLPTSTTDSYTHSQTITSNSEHNIWNIISLFWIVDWTCWSSSILASSINCNEWQGSISWNDLIITPPSNKNWSSYCSVKFNDDEWNEILWTFNYSYNTVQTTTNNWWGWGGWWWGWGGWWGDTYSCKNLPTNATANNKTSPKSNINYSYSTDTNKTCTFQCNNGYSRDEENKKCDKIQIITWVNSEISWDIFQDIDIEKPRKIELFGETDILSNSMPNIDFSRFNESNPSFILSNWFTVEFNNAYEFAHRVWMTTTDSIEKANMNWELTRIAMAKMLSQYAINILWKKPDTTKKAEFEDVSKWLDAQYNNWITLAYQLWIMWIWINKFRPNDKVTRKEFGTALSRMLYGIADWQWLYYSTHLAKLKKEWIINNDNPELTELRWYVMTMLMRSAK